MRRDDRKNHEIGDGAGQLASADKARAALPAPSPASPASARAAQPGLEATIALVKKHHRERCFHMEQRKRADLAIGAFLRTVLGWRKVTKDDPDYDEQLAINETAKEHAEALLEIGEADVAVMRLRRKEMTDGPLRGHDKPALARAQAKIVVDDSVYAEWRDTITAAIDGRYAFDKVEAKATAAMREYAATLPVYAWWKEHVFEDPLQLAVIVGEAGNLSNYPAPYPEDHPKYGQPRRERQGPSCLWKRMGVAVIGAGNGEDDRRQGGLSKSASKDDWIEHGYSRRRRSRLFVIGDVLVKQGGHPYREVYLKRKEFEVKKAEARGLIVAPSAKIPEKRKHEFMSHGHIDKRARRYMEKMLLKDLWKAWRRAFESVAEKPGLGLPAAKQKRERARGGVAARPEVSLPASSPTQESRLEQGLVGLPGGARVGVAAKPRAVLLHQVSSPQGEKGGGPG